MTNFTSVFCGCDPLERHIFWGHTFYVTLNSTLSCQVLPEIWHFWLLWRSSHWPMSTNKSKSLLKLALFVDPLKGIELYTVKHYNFVSVLFFYFSKCFDFESCINDICIYSRNFIFATFSFHDAPETCKLLHLSTIYCFTVMLSFHYQLTERSLMC